MKRLLSVFVVLFLLPLTVTANSGPAIWHSSPISESFSIDEETQIEVLSEQLTFEMPYEPAGENLINLYTTAVYEMHNTSLEEELVTMAFPFVGRMTEVSEEDIVITVDGEPVDFNIYPGEQVHGSNSGYDTGDYYNFEFEDIVEDISDATYWSYLLNEGIEGTHFALHAATNSPSMRVRVTIPVDSGAVEAIAVGPTNAFSEARNLYFEGLCTRDKPFEIFVFGGEATIEVVAFESQAEQKGLDGSNYEVTQSVSNYGEFYDTAIDLEAQKAFQHLEESLGKPSAFNRNDRYNILTELFKEALTAPSTKVITASETNKYIDQFSPDRYMTLVYEVPFEGDALKEVSVSTSTLASYDTKSSERVLYSFDYLLSPAARWKDFKNLTIDIRTDKVMGEIRDSSLEFERVADDYYTVFFTELPDQELKITFEGPIIKDPDDLAEGETLSIKEKYGLDIFEQELEKFDGVFDFDLDISVDLSDVIGMVIGFILLVGGIWILVIRRIERKQRR